VSSRVVLEGRQLLIDGRPRFLRSAEIHYFRLERGAWKDRIASARDGGFNCIASYVPWQWHEPDEGAWDFSAERVPERDLPAFIGLVREAGLHFFARIGPFVNAELAHGGHPLWLYERHPEIRSRDAGGGWARRRNDGDFVPSQLDPRYLELVFRWYERVVDVLRPLSIDNGGPIILMQVDNEPNLVFSYGVEGSLYDPHVLDEGGLWAKWLGREGVSPPRSGRAATREEARLAADWLRFKKAHVFEFIRRLAADVRARGLDLPFTMNEPINGTWPWRSGDHASFARFMEGTGLRMFTNGHCYLHYGGEQNVNGAPVTLARIEAVKMSTLEGPPSIYELGSWYTVPSGALGSYNWDIMTKLLIGSGMNGYSVYVYNDGRLPPGYGKIGASYDWHTAVGHDGGRGGPFEVLRGINRFVECWQQEILSGAKLFDVTVGLSDELPMTAAHIELPPDFLGLPVSASELTAEVHGNLTDLLRALTHLSLNFELTSLESPNREPGGAAKLLIVPNNGSLTRKAAGFVEAHLAAGGSVVFTPLAPVVDAGGEPLERLARLAGQQIADALPRGGRVAGDLVHRMIDARLVREAGLDSPLFVFEPPDRATVLARWRGRAVAYRVGAGAGSVTVLGFLPVFYTAATQRLLDEVLVEAHGLARVASSADGSVFVTARGSGDGPLLLAAAAIRGEDARTRLRVRAGSTDLAFPFVGDLEMRAKEARLLWVNLPLREARLVYTTSQLVKGPSRGEYLASGALGTAGQMAFDRPLSARVRGRKRSVARKGDAWILTYEHAKEPLLISLSP
jgi:beta-galactosidase